MAANFPNSPSINDTFTHGGVTFTWDGTAWKQPASPGVKGCLLYTSDAADE